MGGGVTRILAAVGVRGFATTVQFDLGMNGANGIYSATIGSSGARASHQSRAMLMDLSLALQLPAAPMRPGRQ